MKGWHLHISGRVQGVGFRPTVWRVAHQLGLRGEVCNTTDGVHVHFLADMQTAHLFAERLMKQVPPLALVTQWTLEEAPAHSWTDFQIVESRHEAAPRLMITPDTALCNDCHRELFDPQNRRYHYGFITCTHCGPRYSIIETLPYDRPRTTMAPYDLCPQCQAEYNDPADRRYYAQTNSCPQCPIPLFLWRKGQQEVVPQGKWIEEIVQYWHSGGIVAVKGLGGYLLTCAAQNEEAVVRLRQRKRRPHKPLALMVPQLSWAQRLVQLSTEGKRWLESPVSPIVIAATTEEARQLLPIEALAPGLDELGIMLPYTPLFALLLEAYAQPIVATSGNVSGSPIVYEDEQAVELLGPLCEAVAGYARRIVVPQDDSVLRLSANGTPLWLRRSRGLAPSLMLNRPVTRDVTLAMGAQMKSTFAIQTRGQLFLSQYLGDTSQLESWRSYKTTLAHLMELLAFEPKSIAVDLHPDFPTTQLGQQLAAKEGVETEAWPHHHAHFAAILGEHGLDLQREPVLGIIWDGTGLGTDGIIRGGECFVWQDGQIRHLLGLEPWPHIAGDKMARQSRIAALSLLHDLPEAEPLLRPAFTTTEWKIYHRLIERAQRFTTSMGRLFDAVGFVLGLPPKSTFDGQIAMWLEALAWRHVRTYSLDFCKSLFDTQHLPQWPVKPMMQRLIHARRAGMPPERLAAWFHYSLAHQVGVLARHIGIEKIAFSGGVFQNKLLVSYIEWLWNDHFELYFHQQLPPNDENIAFGQLICHQLAKQPSLSVISPSKNKQHVSGYSR